MTMKLLELEDMLLVGGIAMAGYGIYLVHAPSALIAVGLCLIVLGLRTGTDTEKR